jgi:hypothetical protein
MSQTELSPDCRWALETLFEDRGHEEAPADAERLHTHLAVCPHCRAAAEWDLRLAHLLEADRGPAPPPTLAQRARALARRRRLARRSAIFAAAAAVLLAVGLALNALRGGAQPEHVADIQGLEWIAATPVEPLQVLDRQQDAILQALKEL